LSIEQAVAFVMPLQESVADCPLVMLDGLAAKEPMLGAPGVVVAAVMVSVRAVLVPPAVFTVTSRAPVAAAAPIVRPTVRAVLFCTDTCPTVMPAPLTATVVALSMKFVPVSVSDVVVPAAAVVGLIAVSVGAGGTTVNVRSGLVPPVDVVSVSFREPSGAVAAIVNVATAVVALWTRTLLTVTPRPVITTAAVSPIVKPSPAIVTVTVVPCAPLGGVTPFACGVPDGDVGLLQLAALHSASAITNHAARRQVAKISTTVAPFRGFRTGGRRQPEGARR
jgi:hypothetical protein